ncbi:MAG: response regulator [Eubacteriales bacterium]|nr:response regulator [Eubacteriales bacterium]
MKIMLVDDETNNMDAFEMETEGMEDIEIVGKFQNGQDALAFAAHERVELAVLDVEMPQINGIMLGRKLKERNPGIALVYVTGYKQYAYDAFQLEASAYLLKPFNREDVEKAILRAKKMAGLADGPRVLIRTFGRFEVFVDDGPVVFKSRKAKELLALLVDRAGGIVTTEEILTYLWEDKPDTDSNRSLCRKVIQRLHNTLEEYGIGEIVLRHSRGRSLDRTKVDCDYYRWLEGKNGEEQKFLGEYMTNYGWGEETLSRLLAREKQNRE